MKTNYDSAVYAMALCLFVCPWACLNFRKFRHGKSIVRAVNKDAELYLSHLLSRLSTVDQQCDTYTACILLGLRYESVNCITRISHISSVAVESHKVVDKISAYIDQRRAVHLRQLKLV